MNEFIIYDGLPYLIAPDGAFYAVRWDSEGFTVGNRVDLPCNADEAIRLSELSIMAKCADNLDSINAVEDDADNLDSMTVKELKAYAEANGIDIGSATKKAEIVAAIKAVQEDDSDTV